MGLPWIVEFCQGSFFVCLKPHRCMTHRGMLLKWEHPKSMSLTLISSNTFCTNFYFSAFQFHSNLIFLKMPSFTRLVCITCFVEHRLAANLIYIIVGGHSCSSCVICEQKDTHSEKNSDSLQPPFFVATDLSLQVDHFLWIPLEESLLT